MINITSFRNAAKAALQEARLNGIDGTRNTELEDHLWAYFDALETLARQSQSEPVEGEAVEEGDQ